MVALNSLVQFEQFGFDFVSDVTIIEDWENLTGTCIVKLPKLPFRYGNKPLDKLLKRGERCKLSLGYNERLNVVFEGYVAEVKPTTPVEVLMEDEMFQLKQKRVKPHTFEGKTELKTVLTHIGVTKYVPFGDISWDGGFEISPNEDTAAKVLAKVKEQLNLMIYFKGKTLYIGRPYDPVTANKVRFVYGENIVKHNLEFKRAEDIRLGVEVIINRKDGKKSRIKIGDADGEKRTINLYNESETNAKAIGDRALKKMKYSGLRGDFIAFGEPLVRRGDIVDLVDDLEGYLTGKYWVQAVTRTSGMDGLRQKIKLAERA